jgi:hypothetical protein
VGDFIQESWAASSRYARATSSESAPDHFFARSGAFPGVHTVVFGIMPAT